MHDDSRNLYEHDFQPLLTRNETYMQAIQRGGISIYNLGFKDYELQSIQLPHPSMMRTLRPIIPNDDQVDMLEYIDDALHRHGAFTGERKKKKDRPHSALGRSSSSKRIVTSNTELPLKKTDYKSLLEKKWEPKITKPRDFDCARPIKRTEEQLQREREVVQAIEQEKKMRERLGKRFDLIDEKGEPYMYDNHGRKISVKEYEHRVEEERSKVSHTSPKNTVKFTGALIEKTSKYVEHIRQLANEKKVTWSPNKLPAATIPLEELEEVEVLPLDLVKSWPEYNLLEIGDVMLTVEHCRYCTEHNWITHHNEAKYLQIATSVQSALKDFASKYAVRFFSLLKPIEIEDALQKSLSHSMCGTSAASNPRAKSASAALQIDLPNRVGALEVQVAVKTKKGIVKHLLHSKLYRGAWPKIPQVLRRLEKIFQQLNIKLLASPDDEDNNAADEVIRKIEKRMTFKKSLSKKGSSVRFSATKAQANVKNEEEEVTVLPEFDFRQFTLEPEPVEQEVPQPQPQQLQQQQQMEPMPPSALQTLAENSVFSEVLPQNSTADAYDNLIDGSESKVEEGPQTSQPIVSQTQAPKREETVMVNDTASNKASNSPDKAAPGSNEDHNQVPLKEEEQQIPKNPPAQEEAKDASSAKLPSEQGSLLEAKSSVLYGEDDFCEASASTQNADAKNSESKKEKNEAPQPELSEPAVALNMDEFINDINPNAKGHSLQSENLVESSKSPALFVRDEARKTILDIKAMLDDEDNDAGDSNKHNTTGTHDDHFWNEIDAAVFGEDVGALENEADV